MYSVTMIRERSQDPTNRPLTRTELPERIIFAPKISVRKEKCLTIKTSASLLLLINERKREREAMINQINERRGGEMAKMAFL